MLCCAEVMYLRRLSGSSHNAMSPVTAEYPRENVSHDDRRADAAASKQQHRRWVEQHRHRKDEPPQHVLIAGTDQHREVAHWSQVGLDQLPLAIRLGALDLKAGERSGHRGPLGESSVRLRR